MTAPKQWIAAATGAIIKRAMARRGIRTKALAARVGVTDTMVRFWMSGRYVPSIEHGETLTEVLGDDAIIKAVRHAKVGRCALLSCGRPFEKHWNGGKRVFCSDRCRTTAAARPGERRDPRQEAIDAFCRSCEPDGICRTADCPLRAYSPFLFVPLRRVS